MTVQTGGIPSVDISEFRSINHTVYSALRKAIFDGDFQAGDRIIEAEMSRKLGISRAPIREALHSLQQAGLVEHRPRRGWFVIGLTPEGMWDLYLIRASIEGLAARRVAVQASPELPVQLEATIVKMIASAEDQDLDGLAEHDVQFHELIIQSGGSNQLHRVWKLLHPQDWTIMSVLKLTDIPLVELAQRHHIVLEALGSHDPDWAEVVAKRHIIELARRVLALPPATEGEETTLTEDHR
jgi:DNA-binding GntR family transcriptional regulator